jgi:hypothetical protein
MPDPSVTTRVVIAATTTPEVMIANDTTTEEARFTPLGKDQYEVLVPAGWHLLYVLVSGRCESGMFCGGECEVPATTAVSTWHIETTSKQIETALDPAEPTTVVQVTVAANRPFKATIDTDPADRPEVAANYADASVIWSEVTVKKTVKWKIHLTAEGPCPSVVPCQPPDGEHLDITSIERYVPNAPR